MKVPERSRARGKCVDVHRKGGCDMKHCLIACLLACSTLAIAQDRVPVIRFDSAPDPLKLPNDIYFGEVTGVAVNSQGHVFVLSRGNTTGPAYAAAATQLLE